MGYLSPLPHRAQQRPGWRTLVLTGLVSAILALVAERHFAPPKQSPPDGRCRPQLPNDVGLHPLTTEEPEVHDALLAVDSFVQQSFNANVDLDGLVVAVVTGEGAIYEIGLGPLKANETEPEIRGHVDRNSIFRIASGSKLFAVLEVLIQRQNGALNLDDPIDKYLPGFAYKRGGWANEDDVDAGPITIRHLASHISGMTREYPRGNMDDWPHSLDGIGPPPANGAPFPDTLEETVLGISQYPLNLPTSTYPIYSNAGMALLGQIAVVANAAAERRRGIEEEMIPKGWRELARRDIFDPLGLNGSYFVPDQHNKAHVAVASEYSNEDIDFLDVMSCSGGQMSSLSDYIKLMQTFLDPSLPQSLLPSHILREWMMPAFGWTDDTSEVGLLWEIDKISDSYGRPVRIYQKNGALQASRSVFAINRDMSFGVALLNSGTARVAHEVALDIFRIMQPYLDKLQARKAIHRYAGRWRLPPNSSSNSSSLMDIAVSDGSLWITRLVLEGTDVLSLTEDTPAFDVSPQRIALWSMRRDEFRMALGVGQGVTLGECREISITVGGCLVPHGMPVMPHRRAVPLVVHLQTVVIFYLHNAAANNSRSTVRFVRLR